jgi:hypothetical protein
MRGNYSPQEYGAAISASEDEKLDALIIDSASHEWEASGGVLDMAAANLAAGKKGVLVWQKPKMDHSKHFMLRFAQSPIPLVIICMRAKYPMKELPKEGGGKEWVRVGELEPKQSDDILFEMFVHGWIDRTHKFNRTKCTSKGLEPVFATGQPITLDVGRALAAWASGAQPAKKNEDMPGYRNRILEESEAAAEGGMDVLLKFWQRIPADSKRALEPEKARLKDIAAKADVSVNAGGAP